MKFRLFSFNFPIHEEGKSSLLIAGIAFLLSILSSGISILSVVLLFAFLVICFFFRDPERVVPKTPNAIISPADGIVTNIQTMVAPAFLLMHEGKEVLRVSIFLNVGDVHVNRIPITGRIVSINYNKGKFVNAARDKDSLDNEMNAITMRSESGELISFSQIAGLVARRIVCNLSVGDYVATGDRFGIIKFGSRADVYLPTTAAIKVELGQRMVGGETVIASLV